MNKSELHSKLREYVEKKTSEKFPISDPFLLVCLDEVIESTINSTINGVKFYDHYNNEELITQTLSNWLSTVKSFLKLNASNQNITFRGIPVPPLEDHQELLSQVYQLISLCESE